MWIGLFPELSGVGGIQQVSRHSAAVIAEKAQECNQDYRLFGLNDPAGLSQFRVGEQAYGFRGFGRNKVRLLFHLLRELPHVEILYLGHVNLAPLGMVASWIGPHVQYWVVAHGVEVWHPLSYFRRLGLQHARRVIAVSESTAQSTIQIQRVHPDRVSVVPPALDPSVLGPTGLDNELPIPAHSLVLLTVGRLVSAEPGKGVESVIRILPELWRGTPDIFYVVIGEGDLVPSIAEMVRESPVRERILLAGSLTGSLLKQYYARADIFVMPSRQEGFGLVFLEAMAWGKPVVGGNCGGTPEVVQDGLTGFLVDPNDSRTLAARIAQLLHDEKLRRAMGEAGRRRVETCYTFERFYETLGHMLDAVVCN